MESSINYTVTSTNAKEYDVIRTNLQIPNSNVSRLTVNNLTTKASFIVLGKDDYVIINGNKYNMNDDYGEVPTDTFAEILNFLFEGNEEITVAVDTVKRLVLNSESEFTINDMSYNAKMVSGFYNTSFPIESVFNGSNYQVLAQSAGYSMLTPILYLVSNLGSKCYDNIDNNYCNHKILMRVSNSFSANYPIINGNAEFQSVVPTNSLSDIEFKLVDANRKQIRLLTPMYLSINVEAMESEDEDAKINVNMLAAGGNEQTQE